MGIPAGFEPPFIVNGPYIWDKNNAMAGDHPWVVATGGRNRGKIRPRGWGRVQYLPDGDAEMTRWKQWFLKHTEGCATLEQAAEALNQAAHNTSEGN